MLLAVQKKVFVESGQIALVNINGIFFFLLVMFLKFEIHLSVLCSPGHLS